MPLMITSNWCGPKSTYHRGRDPMKILNQLIHIFQVGHMIPWNRRIRDKRVFRNIRKTAIIGDTDKKALFNGLLNFSIHKLDTFAIYDVRNS